MNLAYRAAGPEPPPRAARTAVELAAVRERQGYLRLLRLVGLLVICLVVLVDPAGTASVSVPIGPALLGYVGVVAAGEATWFVRRRTGRGPLEIVLLWWLLVADAMALVWAIEATGGLDSPLRYLPFLHLVAVVVLCSYRTGVPLCIGYGLLLLEEHERMPVRLAGRAATGTPALRSTALATYLVALAALTLVAAAAAAISERELRRRRLDLEALAELAAETERVTEPADIAATLLTTLGECFGLRRLVLLGPGPEATVLARSPAVARDVLPVPAGPHSLLTRTVAGRAPRVARGLDPAADPWLAALLPGARHLIAVPLSAEAGCQGVLVVEYGRRPGTRPERRLVAIIERFAAHTALALRNALLLERIRRVAAVDGLTGIPNRRTFEEELARETARSVRTGEPFSLIMIDVDHFKVLNDTYGHQVGDDVLAQVAAALQAASRDYDTVARYGGEEFAVIVPACGRKEAEASAGRLLASLRAARTTMPVTASLGFASFPDDASSARRLVDRADQALYAAKRGGRDRVAGYPDLLAAQLAGGGLVAGEPA